MFLVGKDFVLGANLKKAFYTKNGQILQYEIHGASGIIPKVKINYTEIGIYASVSKDQAKNGCELIFRDMADKVKSGLSISLPIPHVGTFKSRGKMCCISFDRNIIENTMGMTAKAHFEGNLFSTNNNKDNLHILNAN